MKLRASLMRTERRCRTTGWIPRNSRMKLARLNQHLPGRGGPRGPGPGLFPFAVIGIVAGALTGNPVEQQQAQATSGRPYRVSVDVDNGYSQIFDVMELNGRHTGERVQIEHGRIKPVYG